MFSTHLEITADERFITQTTTRGPGDQHHHRAHDLGDGVWLAFAVIGGLLLYIGYGFVMSAIVDRTKARAAGIENGIVEKVDGVIAVPCVLLDGLMNMLVMPVICLDLRLGGWFRLVTFRGVTFPFPDLITARLIKYHEDPNERRFRKQIAAIGVLFLDRKDPKGWHVARPPSEAA